MENVLEKSIYVDIRISVEAMCRYWSISKQRLYQLLYAMEEIGPISIVQKSPIKKHTPKAQRYSLLTRLFTMFWKQKQETSEKLSLSLH